MSNLYVHVHGERDVTMLDSDDQPVQMTEPWSKLLQQYAIGTVRKTEMIAWEVEIRIPVRHSLETVSAADLAKAGMLHEDEAGFTFASIMVEPEPLLMTMRVYATDAPGALHNAQSMLGWAEREKAKVMAVNPVPTALKKGR